MKFENLESLELAIARFLRRGVLLAGLLMFMGWMTRIQFSGDPFYELHSYHELPVWQRLFDLLQNRQWGLLLSYLGLVVLIGLPVLRVLLTAVLFIHRKETKMAWLAGLVLFGLMLSLSLGITA